MNQAAAAVQVSKKRGKPVKGCMSVLANCQECGEEVRKTLLKMHIKFYHPKIQDPKQSRATTKARTIFSSAGQDFSTWDNQGPNTMQQSPPVVEKILSTAPSKILTTAFSPVGAWINTEKQCRVIPLIWVPPGVRHQNSPKC